MKFIFIGDIHGKVHKVEEALALDGHKVFVGDFMDSYDRSDSDHAKCLDLVIEAAKKEEATVLYGNHELSYIMPERHRCSGYRPYLDSNVIPAYLPDIQKYFKPFFEPAEDWLVTHAGLHPEVAMQLSENWGQEFIDPSSALHWIGRYRGGLNPVGGIFWCDFNMEFELIEGLNQVFGHTRQRNGIQKREAPNSVNYCIDVLDMKHEFLTLDL